MKLSEIYVAIETGRGPKLLKDRGFATLVAIEHLSHFEEVPVSKLDFTAPSFAAKYPFDRTDLQGAGLAGSRYVAWRSLILNVQLLFAPGDVDGCPWSSLRRAARQGGKAETDGNALSFLTRHLPSGTNPREMSDDLILRLQQGIPVELMGEYRRGVQEFRKLFQNDLVIRTGLLPEKCPSPLKPLNSQRLFVKMSPAVKEWRTSLYNYETATAFNYVYRLAVAAGRLNTETDSLDDFRAAICDLPSPEEVGLRPIQPSTIHNYENRLLRALGYRRVAQIRAKPSLPRLARASQPVTPHERVKVAWADLFALLRGRGWKNGQLNHLSYLRVRAIRAAMCPNELNQSFIDNLERESTKVSDRTALRGAVLSISALSKTAAFSHLPNLQAPEDRRLSHGGASPRMQAELEQLMEFMNVAASTRRGYRVAVGVLSDAMGCPDILLNEFLQADMSMCALGRHEPRRRRHMNIIFNLRQFIELDWTPAWRELQKIVTGAGVMALDNPVPKVLAWRPGTEPGAVTLEWAQRLDRNIRTPNGSSSRGRRDIAETFANQLAAFDALHDVPDVAASGLLPPRIGQIRRNHPT